MKIAIIGAGFTGLSAAYSLSRKHEVTIFEKESALAGLATGFTKKGWDWSLEKYYHHFFTNDNNILTLAKELNQELIIRRPKTSIYIEGKIYQLDSPSSALKLPVLPIWDRLRMGAVIGLLKINPFWQPLEGLKTADFLPRAMGKNAYQKIWEPQLVNKFGDYFLEVSLAWFWARIKKRTSLLAYPAGGYLSFAQKIAKKITEEKAKILLSTPVTEIKQNNHKVEISFNVNKNKPKKEDFDKVIITTATDVLLNITKNLPDDYREKLKKLKTLGTLNLVLRLTKKFLEDNTYWLSICEKNAPLMSIVEQTNYIDDKYYNNEHVVYLGNYLKTDHPYFRMTKTQLLEIFSPFLERINPGYKRSIIDFDLFKSSFAQPIIPANYSGIVPPIKTPLADIYLANMQQVYPWDRGTNYAVELGKKVAVAVSHSVS